MHRWLSTVASCAEHERLAFEDEHERWSIMNGGPGCVVENFGERKKGWHPSNTMWYSNHIVTDGGVARSRRYKGEPEIPIANS
jgi:hypothetical protein